MMNTSNPLSNDRTSDATERWTSAASTSEIDGITLLNQGLFNVLSAPDISSDALPTLGKQPTVSSSTSRPYSSEDQISSAIRKLPIRVHGFGKRRFSVVAEWEGVVTTTTPEGFSAEIYPVDQSGTIGRSPEFTEFAMDDVNEDDRILVCEGAMFHWTIGHARNEAGTTSNASVVAFRRVPTRIQVDGSGRSGRAAEIAKNLGLARGQ